MPRVVLQNFNNKIYSLLLVRDTEENKTVKLLKHETLLYNMVPYEITFFSYDYKR